MKYFTLAFLGLIFISSANAEISYNCGVKKIVQLSEKGNLVQTEWTKMLEKQKERIIFVPNSGFFKILGNSQNLKFEVIENGNSANSLKAIRIVQGPASTVLETFRINTFAKSEFLYVSGDTVRTGTCLELGN